MKDMSALMEEISRRRLVEIHKFQYNGVNILLDVNRVNYFEIDDAVSDFVELFQGQLLPEALMSCHSSEAIIKAVKGLEDNGFFDCDLITETEGGDISNEQIIENLVVNVSNDCNLRCRYCFANTGPYKATRSLMEDTTARRALEWFVGQSADKPKLNLHFFGGEPFMNDRLVSSMADYVRVLEKKYEKKIFLNVCTNGTIVNDDIIDMIKRHEMGVQISIDGPKALHDAFRPYSQGFGSYDTIAENIRRLLGELPADRIIARATIPHGAIHITDVVEHLFSMGFHKVFFVPAMGCGKWAVREEDIEDIRVQYDRLAETYIEHRRKGQDFNVFPFAAEVSNVGDSVKKLYGCGAGLGFASVSLEGKIYPCMRFTDDATYCIGNIYEGLNSVNRAGVINRTVEQRPICSMCWARYLCGGACIAISAEKNMEIENPDPIGCHMAKHVARLAMYVNAKLTAEGIEPAQGDVGDFDFVRRRIQ